MMTWADEYLAAARVTDLARDPDDFRVTRQSKATIGGLLVPVNKEAGRKLQSLFTAFELAFGLYQRGVFDSRNPRLTATMEATLRRSASHTKDARPWFDYISLDPRDYTIFTAPDIPVPVVSIHTRPERCWFLGVLRFEGALGLSLGRLRVSRPTEQGVYPVTIRTKWRALTNKRKQEEVRDAYQRLIRGEG